MGEARGRSHGCEFVDQNVRCDVPERVFDQCSDLDPVDLLRPHRVETHPTSGGTLHSMMSVARRTGQDQRSPSPLARQVGPDTTTTSVRRHCGCRGSSTTAAYRERRNTAPRDSSARSLREGRAQCDVRDRWHSSDRHPICIASYNLTEPPPFSPGQPFAITTAS